MPGRSLRIAGGTARGVPLAVPRGARLRPTSGQVREAIFNILAGRVEGTRVLDLYAGTGALGIEALSRGASEATFIEAAPRLVEAILQTLSRAGLGAGAKVLRGRLPSALQAVTGPFDIVFLDPPYEDRDAPDLLLAIAPLLAPGGVVVFEHGSRYNPPERPNGLQLRERRAYGDTGVALYEAEEGK